MVRASVTSAAHTRIVASPHCIGSPHLDRDDTIIELMIGAIPTAGQEDLFRSSLIERRSESKSHQPVKSRAGINTLTIVVFRPNDRHHLRVGLARPWPCRACAGAPGIRQGRGRAG